MSFIESMGVTCSDSISHNRVQVLSIPVLQASNNTGILNTCTRLWLTELEQATPVNSQVRQTPEEGRRTDQPKRCGNSNKDEDKSPKTLNDKNLFLFIHCNICDLIFLFKY